MEYKKFLLNIDEKKYGNKIDHRNKSKLIQKIQEDKLKQTININLEYLNIEIEIILNKDVIIFYIFI